MGYTIDTAASVEELTGAGVEPSQAHAIVRVVSRTDESLATRADVAATKAELKADIRALEARLDARIDTMEARFTRQVYLCFIGLAGLMIALRMFG